MSEYLVPFVPIRQRYADERTEILACLDQVLERGQLVLGAEVDAFEAAIAEFTGAGHCVSLNSGADALMMGLLLLGVSRGDEVITAPNSFVASVGAIAHVGATPRFADVGDDQCMNVEDLVRRIGPRTRAIMPVHLAGRLVDMDALKAVAQKHAVPVIEDAAQAIGAYWNGTHAGVLGDIGCFSLHPLKALNGLGDGGFLLTDNPDFAAQARLYRNHGLQDRDTCVMFGVNSRLDSLNAAVLLLRLRRVKEVVDLRRRHSAQYRELLCEDVFVAPERLRGRSSYTNFVIHCDRRDGLQRHLKANGIASAVHYPTPLHLQPAAASLGFGPGSFPVVEQQAGRILSLPNHQYLTEDQVALVATTVNHYFGAADAN